MKFFLTSAVIILFVQLCFSQPYWTQVVTTGNIPAREHHGMVYDSIGNRLIVFGGEGQTGYLNDLWSLDLNAMEWAEIPVLSTQQPEARRTAKVFLDSENNLWTTTGQSGTGLHNDVWKFSFQDSLWAKFFSDTLIAGVVNPRYGTAGIFDPVTNNFILFAGFATNGRVKDTHTFSLDSIVWTNRGLPARPERRCLHNGVFADDRREFWIFGGQFEGNRNDTWRMAVDSFIWQEFIPPVAPPARHFHSMIYKGDNEMVVFGGNALPQGNYSGALNDLWTFNGDQVTWDTLPQGNVIPEPRIGHSAAYLPFTDQMIVFGGRNANGFFDDVWIYDFNPINVATEGVIGNTLSIALYPNPARQRISLSFNRSPGAFDLSIFDTRGLLLLKDESGSTDIDISLLPTGIYFVRVITQERDFVLKLVVK